MTHLQSAYIDAYMSGKIQLKELAVNLKMTVWYVKKLVNLKTSKAKVVDSNFLYDQRMAEVTAHRSKHFTPEQISTQKF